MMRNSCTALRGKGFPRLSCWPATPPARTSFLRLAPSMKMLMPSGPCAPLENVLDVPSSRPIVTLVPGSGGGCPSLGRLEAAHCIEAASLRRRLAPRGRLDVHGDDAGSFERCSARVGHVAANAACARLAGEWRNRGRDNGAGNQQTEA